MALTVQEQESLKAVVASIWNQSIADSLDYNDDVAEVVRTAVEEIGKCSKGITDLFIDITKDVAEKIFTLPWLLKLGMKVGAELAKANVSGANRACINTPAANWRSPLEMASLGI